LRRPQLGGRKNKLGCRRNKKCAVILSEAKDLSPKGGNELSDVVAGEDKFCSGYSFPGDTNGR
jgi:hypothetical protein